VASPRVPRPAFSAPARLTRGRMVLRPLSKACSIPSPFLSASKNAGVKPWDHVMQGQAFPSHKQRPLQRCVCAGPAAASPSCRPCRRVGSCYVGRSTMLRVRPVQLPPTCAPRHSAPPPTWCASRGTALATRSSRKGCDGLGAADHSLCVRAQSAREFVTEASSQAVLAYAAPKRCGSELEL
jgi:hypothetical protein